jgi:starvation-inducible DNA-binding protein
MSTDAIREDGAYPRPVIFEGSSMATQHKTTERQFSTHIDIAAEKRAALIEMLNQHLADTSDLKSQVKQAHWNVKGKDFYQLHLLFDEIAGEVEGFVDLIAERVTTLGGYATGTVRMAAEHSALPEYPTNAIEGHDHVKALTDRFGLYAGRIRQGISESDEIGDPTTADLYTQISRVVDQRLWFLEAHIQS